MAYQEANNHLGDLSCILYVLHACQSPIVTGRMRLHRQTVWSLRTDSRLRAGLDCRRCPRGWGRMSGSSLYRIASGCESSLRLRRAQRGADRIRESDCDWPRAAHAEADAPDVERSIAAEPVRGGWDGGKRSAPDERSVLATGGLDSLAPVADRTRMPNRPDLESHAMLLLAD